MTTAAFIDAAIRAVAPSIRGVAIGSPLDKATWRITFPTDVDERQRAAAMRALEAFDVLAPVKASLLEQVDAEAERRREAVSTRMVGKSHEYAFLALEAASVISGEAARSNMLSKASLPLLAAGIGVDVPNTGNDATDLTAAAHVVHAKRGGMYAAYAAIRAARLKGAAAITAATSVSAAESAFASIAWPST